MNERVCGQNTFIEPIELLKSPDSRCHMQFDWLRGSVEPVKFHVTFLSDLMSSSDTVYSLPHYVNKYIFRCQSGNKKLFLSWAFCICGKV